MNSNFFLNGNTKCSIIENGYIEFSHGHRKLKTKKYGLESYLLHGWLKGYRICVVCLYEILKRKYYIDTASHRYTEVHRNIKHQIQDCDHLREEEMLAGSSNRRVLTKSMVFFICFCFPVTVLESKPRASYVLVVLPLSHIHNLVYDFCFVLVCCFWNANTSVVRSIKLGGE